MSKAYNPVNDMGQLATDAFNKLASYIYFDNQNLLIRKELAEFIDSGKQLRLESFATNVDKYSSEITYLIDKIGLTFLPKNVKENTNLIHPKYLSKRFYTNQNFKGSALVDRVNIFIDAPFEIHLISTMWLLRYGMYFDEDLGDHCRGNRLEHSTKKLKGRLLFKKYDLEYEKWWSDGISAAKDLFKDKEDVTILNFDFKNYYHSVELDLNELTNEIEKQEPGSSIHSLHLIFVDIHKDYFQKIASTGFYSIKNSTEGVPLPIGLLSSGVLANWYLKEFDALILQSIDVKYYGRYVDDLMIVVRNSIIEQFNQENVRDIIESNIQFDNDQHYIVHHFITKYFSSVFRIRTDHNYSEPAYLVNLDRYSNLFLQSNKFFIYQFDSEYSPQLLNRFIEEQQEKSSVFQFLSEDDDNIYKDLDKVTFDSNIERDSDSVGGLKHIEENKFKLSIYLSKLTRGSIASADEYDPEEAQKVKSHFKGFYLLRNYFFWEKILCLWLVRNDYATFFETIERINHQIDKLEVAISDGDIEHTDELSSNIKKGLRAYLDVAIKMAIGVFPEISNSKDDKSLTKLNLKNVGLYRQTFLLRKNFISFPLLQFTRMGSTGSQALFKKSLLDEAIKASKDQLEVVAAFFPYRVKFHECCLFIFIRHLNRTNDIPQIGFNVKANFFDNEGLLNEAFDLFCKINGVKDEEKQEVMDQYFKFSELNKQHLGQMSFPDDVLIKPIKVPSSRPSHKGNMRVCLVNKFVDARESKDSMMGSPKNDNKRYEDFNKIFDDIKKVKDPDIVIMPEICLPYHFMSHAVQFCASNQTGLITGVEHWSVNKFVFNFVLTVLPIRVFDDNDVIVLPRLKNHYAPAESKEIWKGRFCVPTPKPYQYELILWRNVYFTTYYCFELADVKHRNLLLGLIDVLFAPVWNMDVHYYNSLVESASRDMHCFIVLANTTQFGDSRITRPAKHIRRDKLRIKGGTVKDHRAIVVVSDLEIDSLRKFQIEEIPFDITKPIQSDEESLFKPLPPDFPVLAAKLRTELELFEIDAGLYSWLILGNENE